MISTLLFFLCFFISGVTLFSGLFLFTDNYDTVEQLLKPLVAAFHCMVMIIPVFMAQSRFLLFRIVGYGLVVLFFLYSIFMTGFFSYFGFLPDPFAFGAANVADAIEVVDHYFDQVFGIREIVFIVVGVITLALIPRFPLPAYALVLLIFPAVIYTHYYSRLGSPTQADRAGNARLVRRFGIAGFVYAMTYKRVFAKDGYLAPPTNYPGKVAGVVFPEPETAPPFEPIPTEIIRFILTQIESFDPQAIDAELNGQPVMPFISGLRDKCLSYSNYYTLKGMGGSSDSEFSVATGLIPSLDTPVLRYTDYGQLNTLYDTLAAAGITSRFVHNNHSGFYGRVTAYSQIDAVEAVFQSPREHVEEAEFAEAALAETLERPERTFHYFFNYASHGPYRGFSTETEEKFSLESRDDKRERYLATMHEVDQMLEALFDLQRDSFGRGENIFMVTADHPSYLHIQGPAINAYRIPALICHNNFSGKDVSNVFGPVDLHATILDAFGLKPEQELLGQSLFRDFRNAVLTPKRELIYLNEKGNPVSKICGKECDQFFNYTLQHVYHRF